eukprot:3362095-Amphidinium_carterae.1
MKWQSVSGTSVDSRKRKELAIPRGKCGQQSDYRGYKAVGMTGRAGEIKEGQAADVTLWDLTSLALLPRTDPMGLLVLGEPTWERCTKPASSPIAPLARV